MKKNLTKALIKTLKLLSGKKSAIAALVGATISYLAVKNFIGEPEVIYLNAISIIVFGSASYATGRLVYGKK